MTSWKTPTPSQVDTVVSKLVHREHHRYFFYKLENPEWIGPLSEKGFFTQVPKVQRQEGKGTISFPLWPESNYLARMAKHKPETVLKLMLSFTDVENINVHADLVEAALSMPADLASVLVKKEIQWFQKQTHLYMFLPDKLGGLVVHLAKGGQCATALKLLKVLLDIVPDPQQPKESNDGGYAYPLQPKAKFDSWEYGEVLKKNIPELTKACGVPVFILLCELLETAIRLSKRNHADKSQQDYSYIWRPNIEHDSEHSRDLENDLVSGVRDTAKLIVAENLASVDEVIKILQSHNWEIFQRIELFLLKLFPERVPTLLVRRLTDYALFDSFSMRREYHALLSGCFRLLNEDQKKVILGWIEKGPDLENFEQYMGTRPIDEAAQKYRKQWQRDRLSWIKDDLVDSWKVRYDELIKEMGQPGTEEMSGGWTGPTSPKSMDELKQMSVADILNFFEQWRPTEGWMVSSPEGLGRTLTEVIKQQPERFMGEALNFKKLHPTYVRALITGLSDSLKTEKQISLDALLDLCYWVVQQPREISNEELGFGKGAEPGWSCDPNWGWTRSAIARFLSEALSTKKIQLEKRAIVWEIIKILALDPDPTPEHEAKNSSSDASHLAINSTRGEAIQTVIQYALWVRRHLEKDPNAADKLENGFNEMLEVRSVLEEHLDISKDPSFAIRSVYGKFFPWLQLMDPKWTQENVLRIFPAEEDQRAYYDVAWNTYITFCSPYDKVFEILGNQYALAVSSINVPKKGGLGDPNEELVEHLMVFYWRGKLILEEPNGLLQKFWRIASGELRGHAIQFIGRSIYNEKDAVPAHIIERMKNLWQERLAEAKSAPDAASYVSEMNAFGMWFVSKKFDDNWALMQLIEVLKISGRIDRSNLVVGHLAELVTQMPNEVVEALHLIVEGKEESGIYSWRDTAKEILGKALLTTAKKSAEDLINYLGRLGYLEFGELLQI